MKKTIWSELLLIAILSFGVITFVAMIPKSAKAEETNTSPEQHPLVQNVVTYNTANGGSAMRSKTVRYYRPDYGVITINPQARGQLARPAEPTEVDDESYDKENE